MFLCDNTKLDLVTRQCLSSLPPCWVSLFNFESITITKVCCSLRYKNSTDLVTPVLKTCASSNCWK